MITKGNLKGRELRKLRKEAGLRQDQLASLLCVVPVTVHNWETGKTGISAPMEIALRTMLDVKIAEKQMEEEE